MEKVWLILLPLLGMLRFVPPFTEFADESDGPSADAYLQEDGSSYFLLEDGVSYLLKE